MYNLIINGDETSGSIKDGICCLAEGLLVSQEGFSVEPVGVLNSIVSLFIVYFFPLFRPVLSFLCLSCFFAVKQRLKTDEMKFLVRNCRSHVIDHNTNEDFSE
jgi:hypothetical protein